MRGYRCGAATSVTSPLCLPFLQCEPLHTINKCSQAELNPEFSLSYNALFDAGLGQTRPVTVRKISANHNDLISKFEPSQRRTSLYERRTSQSSLLNGLSSATPSASTSGTSTPRHENVEKPYEIAEKLSVAGSALTSERRRSSVTGKPKILRTKAEVSLRAGKFSRF